jgi:antitoxin (DNA-binding transcriptional repressor) of toxin-antitoxin stability system
MKEVSPMPKSLLTKEVSLEEAKARFDALISEVQEQEVEVVIKQADKPVARIVPPLSACEEARRRFFARADELRRKFADVPARELEAMIDRAVTEVRAQGKKRARHD